MNTDRTPEPGRPFRRFAGLPGVAIAASLLVLAGVVVLTTLQLRKGIRQQIAGRDGEVLYAMALLHYAEAVEMGLGGPVESSGDPLGVLLKSAELRGVLGVRLFDAQGRLVECFPPALMEEALSPGTLEPLHRHRPVSRFHPEILLGTLFYPDDKLDFSRSIPLLEINVPLHAAEGGLDGIAQFLVEGHSIAAEYARLDRRLAIQACTAFGLGGVILTVALAWAFQRLNRAHRLLAERTENLTRANQELVLAAKTSALGAVTAHLIHGLKNPLAGLQGFVSAHSGPTGPLEESDWQHAVASTRRMQSMINHVVGVLREDQAVSAYDVTLAELENMVRVRVQPLARERGVDLAARVQAEGALPNRVANLVALILVNLCENAIQATPRGKRVALTVGRTGGHLRFTVRDEGPGFPADIPLFMPCRSGKPDGTGVGLALCKQLANHLNAVLELAHSTSAGCEFQLTISVADDPHAVPPKERSTREPSQT